MYTERNVHEANTQCTQLGPRQALCARRPVAHTAHAYARILCWLLPCQLSCITVTGHPNLIAQTDWGLESRGSSWPGSGAARLVPPAPAFSSFWGFLCLYSGRVVGMTLCPCSVCSFAPSPQWRAHRTAQDSLPVRSALERPPSPLHVT